MFKTGEKKNRWLAVQLSENEVTISKWRQHPKSVLNRQIAESGNRPQMQHII